jgi:hypothetical protein
MASLIGSGINQVSTNGMLGELAFMNATGITVQQIQSPVGIATTNSIFYGETTTANNYTNLYLQPLEGNVVVGSGVSLSTTAAKGFLCLPTCFGAPTGILSATPPAAAEHIIDSSNRRAYYFINNSYWAYSQITDQFGNFIIGTGASTGTSSQILQVNSGTYISGNIGIGTTNPIQKIHIIGNSLVTGISTAAGFSGSLNSTGVSTIATLQSPQPTYTSPGTNNITVNVSTGSIGIVTFATSGSIATCNITNPVSGSSVLLWISNPTTSKTVNIQVGGTNIPTSGISSGSIVGNGATWSIGANYLVNLNFISGTTSSNTFAVIR